MNFLKRLFEGRPALKQCPRCLGKGHVDWSDIKRLNQELKWTPGSCAYCNGSGKVEEQIESKVPVDATYLVNNLDDGERQKIINGDTDAIERGKMYEVNVNRMIAQICYLHFETGLTSVQIATFFSIGREGSMTYEIEKQEFADYVKKVIQKNTRQN